VPPAGLARAFADGLRLNAASRDQGRVDGRNGLPWPQGGVDLLAYALGYAEGELDRKCRAGEQAP
jgi:hypothetical protein